MAEVTNKMTNEKLEMQSVFTKRESDLKDDYENKIKGLELKCEE